MSTLTVKENNNNTASTVALRLEEDVRKNRLKAGDRLRPIRVLATKYGVSYVTMQKSISTLEAKGFLEVKHGSGIFVKEETVKGKFAGKNGFIVNMILAGYDCDMARFPVYAKLLYGVENEVARLGGKLIVFRVHNEKEIDEMVDGDTDGYLLFWNDNIPGLKEALKNQPCVWLMGIEKHWGDHITFNDFSIGKVVSDYLVSRSHKRVAYVGAGLGSNHERRVGFEYFTKDRDLKIEYLVDEKAVIPDKGGDRFDIAIIDSWLDFILNPAEKFDVVFAENDAMAVNIYNAIERRGLTVGKDIEVIGCNCEESLLAGLPRRSTTVDIHSEEIGAMGVEYLMWRKRNPLADRRVIKIEPSIKVFPN